MLKLPPLMSICPARRRRATRVGARLVARPHRRRQTVDGAVGDAHRVVLVPVRDDGQHGTEDLFLGDDGVGLDAAEHRGHDVVALVEPGGRLRPAKQKLRALVDAGADVAAHPFALRRRHQRAQLRLALQRVADREGLAPPPPRAAPPPRSGSRGTSRRVSALQVWPELRKQTLSVVLTAAARSASSSTIDADLPPSSSATRLTRTGSELGDAAPGPRRAGEGHHVHIRVAAPAPRPPTRPVPQSRLKTPAGSPAASMISARMKALSGATSLGLSTTVQPAASAGATLAAI